MSALRNLVDKIKPTFTKGGKLGFLESTFDAFETFLFVPNTTTQKGAHIRDCNDMKRTMIMVVVALMPALLFGFYNTGYLHFLSQGVQPEFWASLWFGFLKVLPIIVVSYVVGLGIEFAFAQARGHEVNEGFLVTGLLIPMVMPVDIPLWMVALATAFSVIFGKEVFGGTGMNVFNPALLARAFAFFAYTPSMSGATVWIAGLSSGEGVVDGFSGATALENLSTTGQMGYSAMDAFLGFIPGCVGETSALAILIGGIALIALRVIHCHIPLAIFVTITVFVWIVNLASPGLTPGPMFHLLTGGVMIGAFFMATDMVTSPVTHLGGVVFGIGIGIIVCVIRIWGSFPEGMSFAIVIMNALVPLIDKMCYKRPFGWHPSSVNILQPRRGEIK